MIIVEDHSQTPHEDLWARSVDIVAHQVVEESYVAFNIEITTLRGTKVRLWRRYAEFDQFYTESIDESPEEQLAIPALPPKSSNRGLDNDAFLRTREDGLNYFIKCVLLNPSLARSQAVKRFIANK